MKRIINRVKSYLKHFFLIDDTPHKVAGGAALGFFWGIMPGEGVVTTLVTASILRFNRLSATAGVLATNMWTTVVLLPPAAIAGGFLFHTDSHALIENFKSTYHQGLINFFTETIFSQVIFPLIVGFFIVSLTVSLLVYIILYLLLKYKKIKIK